MTWETFADLWRPASAIILAAVAIGARLQTLASLQSRLESHDARLNNHARRLRRCENRLAASTGDPD